MLLPVHYYSVLISIPSSHKTWQLRTCGVPAIDTRHSKQIPIPQTGHRGSPVTDVRQASPVRTTATATVEPADTANCLPFNVTVI
jgi:hypothetical protein